jgi:quinol monooxygenase YgiN
MSAIHLVLTVEIAPENIAAWRELMTEMVAATEREAGTTIYEWYYSSDGRTCCIHERYRDSAACDEHVANFIANFGARFLGSATSVAVAVHGDPSATVRETIAGLEPVYLELAAGFAR